MKDYLLSFEITIPIQASDDTVADRRLYVVEAAIEDNITAKWKWAGDVDLRSGIELADEDGDA